ncbi:MAG TPA: hypothetical protein VHR45_22775 [Thermoanaerobaculia bacterium]|nr:hypothetical protein [Thermoanaerobaculia bacterium]
MNHRLASLAIVVAALAPGALCAQNLLSNPNFDSSLAGWTSSFTTWDGTLDAGNSPSSGSAKTINALASGGQACAGLLSQCAQPVTPGALYAFGASVFIPAGQKKAGNGSVEVDWFSDAGCVGGSIQQDPSPAVFSKPSAGTWTLTTITLPAPPGATSAFVHGLSCEDSSGPDDKGPLQINFDNMFFRSAAIAAVPALDTWGLVTLGLVLAAAGASALGRTGRRGRSFRLLRRRLSGDGRAAFPEGLSRQAAGRTQLVLAAALAAAIASPATAELSSPAASTRSRSSTTAPRGTCRRRARSPAPARVSIGPDRSPSTQFMACSSPPPISPTGGRLPAGGFGQPCAPAQHSRRPHQSLLNPSFPLLPPSDIVAILENSEFCASLKTDFAREKIAKSAETAFFVLIVEARVT